MPEELNESESESLSSSSEVSSCTPPDTGRTPQPQYGTPTAGQRWQPTDGPRRPPIPGAAPPGTPEPRPQMEQTIQKPVQLKMAFFLDVCSGLSAPLSTALQGKNRAILRPVDSHPRAGGHDHDISRPKVVDFLIRLGKSGVVRVAHGAN